MQQSSKMTNLIVVFCVLGTTSVLLCSAHRPPHPPAPPQPPRHPLRFQRMAPRHGPPQLHHHNRPVRQYAPHPNMIPGGGKPHRGRPRLHIPLLHGLRPGPPRHHHPHHHHHHHHNHQQGHHTQQQLLPQYHPQVQQRPQQQTRPQQYHPQGPFGYPSIDSTPQHTAPASIRGHHPQALPVRQFAPQNIHHGAVPSSSGPYGFHQDEIPFAGEMDLPSTTGAYQPINLNTSPSTQPQHTPQHTTQSYGETSAAPQPGFMGSPYKGWKPIAKPFQSQYPRQQQNQPQHVPEQFSSTPAGLPDFPQGPPQHFPQMNDNHLHSFPIHDFPSGPSGPPGGAPQLMEGGQGQHQQQQHPHQHQHDSILDQFMNEPQPQGHHHNFNRPQHHIQRVPQQQHHHNQLPDFPQHPFPHDAPHHQFSNGRHPHADYSLPPQSSTTPRDIFPQFLPSGPAEGGSSAGDAYNLNTNTLFRENAMQIRPNPNQIGHHGMAHHPLGNNNEVIVPLPPGMGDGVRLPSSLFTENNYEASQSEENLVVKKPKFSLKHKLNQQRAQEQQQQRDQQGGGGAGGVQGGSSDETIENQLQVLPKFKPRPKFQKEKEEEDQKRDEEGGNGGNGGKGKLNGGRGRVRIRTRLRRPNPFSNSEEDNRGDAPEKSVFPPFPGVKSEAPRRPIFRKQPPPQSSQDNNLSNENNSGENGPPGPPPPALGGPPSDRPKGPISEELSNFPTLPFPSPGQDFMNDFPGAHSPVPPPPSPPPPPVKERDSPRHPSRSRQPSLPPQQSSIESEQRGGLAHTPGIRDNAGEQAPSGRPGGGGRRRRPRPRQPPRNEDDHQDNPKDDGPRGPQGPPQKGPQGDVNPAVFNDEFFFPPGFSQDPTKSTGDQPVSFISMPNGKPQVIHHVPQPHNPQQQHHHQQQQQQHHAPIPQSQEQGNHFPVHRGNLFQGNTQHFPPLEEFGGGPQNFGRPPSPPPPPQHHQGHHGGHHGLHNGAHHGFNHQLSAFSDNRPFAHRPPPRRKPPVHLPPPPQPTYAYPTSNPYAVPPTGPTYLPPSAPTMIDNAPQTSNSYEVHPTAPSPPGPVYHPAPAPHPPPPQRPSHAPPRQRLPAGGRIPPRHQQDPMVIPQSSEYEQIPAQYVEPTQATPVTSPAPNDKPHEYHSPDIHPPGTFFDEFFKPFDTPAGGTPSPDPHDEQQSNSNVNSVKVLPSNSSSNSSPTWSKSKDPSKESSTKKPSRIPPKNLKAKIADIARKNFQSHLATADPDPTIITTYKPTLSDVNTTSIPIASLSKETVPDPDDTADRNAPKRFSSKTDSGPMLVHRRPQVETSHDGTTILFKSKRQFKKKKPIVKDTEPSPRSHELSSTTRSALRAAHKSVEPSEDSPSSSSPRVGVLRRRKLFPRRRAFPLKKDSESATPSPSSAEESVTYGESQWFRVKGSGSTDDEHKPRVTVSSSSSSSTSSSSLSTTPPAKKSSKFTMSRLSMQ